MRRIGWFFVGGVIGFIVDAGVVQSLVSFADFDPYLARVISFLCAATTTWIWNRHTTFSDIRGQHRWHAEWARWMLAMTGGASLNYSIYALAVWQIQLVHSWPAIGVGMGSVVGSTFNFLSARRWVFGSAKNERETDT